MTGPIHHTTIPVPLYLYDPEGNTVSQVDPTATPHECNMQGCPGPVNKRRLEALPDLLAAAQAALALIVNHFGDSGDNQDLLRTAIRKAKGEEA